MLYAKLDDQYDQLVMVVGRQLTGLGHVYRRHRFCQQQTDNCRLSITIGDSGRGRAVV